MSSFSAKILAVSVALLKPAMQSKSSSPGESKTMELALRVGLSTGGAGALAGLVVAEELKISAVGLYLNLFLTTF